MKVALIICTYERPELLKKLFDSLDTLTKKPNELVYVDDNSSDFFVRGVLHMQSVYANVIMKPKRLGIKDSLLQGFNAAFELGCDLAINLDSDAIVKPDFITRLKDLKARFPDRIVSGFNCNNPANPVLFDGEDYVERRHCNGINMCINREQYESIVRPALLSNGNWDYNSTHNKNIVISKPSVLQHLGANNSTMGHNINPDIACDF